MLIAANMVAEVCSLYVMRPGQVLELYATEGLKREAVHTSKLKVGEGLVGTIAADAEILNLADAQSHPAFKYLPETGEEIYQLLPRRADPAGRASRSACWSCKTARARHYSEEEEEALQTTAMVLAEIIAAGELRESRAPSPPTSRISAAITSRARRWPKASRSAMSCCTSRASSSTNLIAENMPAEKRRLDQAIESPAAASSMTSSTGPKACAAANIRRVLEAFRMFAHDRGWVNGAARNGRDRPYGGGLPSSACRTTTGRA